MFPSYRNQSVGLQSNVSHHIETSQFVYKANQLTGFCMMGTLVVKGLMKEYSLVEIVLILYFLLYWILRWILFYRRLLWCFSLASNTMNISKFLYLQIIKSKGHNANEQKTKVFKFVKIFRSIIRSVFV